MFKWLIYIITAVLKVETDIITSITVSPIGNEQKVYYNKHNLFLLHVLQENDLSLRQTRFDCSFFFVITVNTTIATPKGNKTILKL